MEKFKKIKTFFFEDNYSSNDDKASESKQKKLNENINDQDFWKSFGESMKKMGANIKSSMEELSKNLKESLNDFSAKFKDKNYQDKANNFKEKSQEYSKKAYDKVKNYLNKIFVKGYQVEEKQFNNVFEKYEQKFEDNYVGLCGKIKPIILKLIDLLPENLRYKAKTRFVINENSNSLFCVESQNGIAEVYLGSKSKPNIYKADVVEEKEYEFNGTNVTVIEQTDDEIQNEEKQQDSNDSNHQQYLDIKHQLYLEFVNTNKVSSSLFAKILEQYEKDYQQNYELMVEHINDLKEVLNNLDYKQLFLQAKESLYQKFVVNLKLNENDFNKIVTHFIHKSNHNFQQMVNTINELKDLLWQQLKQSNNN